MKLAFLFVGTLVALYICWDGVKYGSFCTANKLKELEHRINLLEKK